MAEKKQNGQFKSTLTVRMVLSLSKQWLHSKVQKNKNKWFWSVTTSAEKLNEELVVWYVETITAFYDFFEQEPAGKE